MLASKAFQSVAARGCFTKTCAAAFGSSAAEHVRHMSSNPLYYRRLGSLQHPGDSSIREVTVFPGHGIGPELVESAMKVIEATNAPIEWDVVDNIVDRVTDESLESLCRTRVGIKGEFRVGAGRDSLPSINIELRRALNLYANVVHSFNHPGVVSRHEDVDIVMIRENTEGEYSGMEHEVVPGVTESLKVMSRAATLRIAKFAFEYAFLNNRSKVTAVHKANIMKKADGLFLESCREVATQFPNIKYEEIIVDNCMMQLVSRPQQFDVMVTPNFYGSLVSNVVAGLIGGPGISPGANIGDTGALFEQGARHVGEDIAGKGVVNPTGILLSGCSLLRHVRLPAFANRIEKALFDTLHEGKNKTRDVGGSASTNEFVNEIIARLKDQ